MDEVIASFKRSIPKLLGMLTLSVLFTLAGALMALGVIGDTRPGSLNEFFGYAGALFFGLCALGILLQLLRGGPIVEVTTSGIRYYRLSPDIIPWTAISDMSVEAVGHQRFLMLKVRPDARPQLSLSRYSRVVEIGNGALGFHGLPISMTGLSGSLDDLIRVVEIARAKANDRRNPSSRG